MQGEPSSGKPTGLDFLAAGLGVLALVAALWLAQASAGRGQEPPAKDLPIPPAGAKSSPAPGSALLEAERNLREARALLDIAERSREEKPGGDPVSHDRVAEQVRLAMVEREQEQRAAYIHTTTLQTVAGAPHYAARIRTMCGLSETQEQDVLAILQDQVRAYEPVMLAATVDMEAIRRIDENADARILALMSPEQAAKWPKARRPWLQAWANRSGDR